MSAAPARPANLTLGVDDRPAAWAAFTLGVQHAVLLSAGLSFAVMLAREIGCTPAQTAAFVSASLMAAGLGTILQALRSGPVGSGYLCPEGPDPSLVPACMIAGKVGGLPMVFGMTALAGLLEALVAPAVVYLRVLLPVEVTGVVVTMVGMSFMPWAASNMLALPIAGAAPAPHGAALTGLVTLAAMVAATVWCKGTLRRYPLLIGVAAGYVTAMATGVLGAPDARVIASAAVIAPPSLIAGEWRIDPTVMLPFAIAIVCSLLKNVGDITTCQKVNDANWKRPEMQSIRGGVVADAASTVFGGLIGGLGPASYSACVGLSVATGVTSRTVGFWAGAVCIALSLSPALASVMAVMPAPVMGAEVLFCTCFMMVAGLQIIATRMLDARRTFTVGLSIATGVTTAAVPQIAMAAPDWLKPILASSLYVSTLCAIALNLLFRLGITRSSSITAPNSAEAILAATRSIQTWGAQWGARVDIIQRASAATTELIEYILATQNARSDLHITGEYDELHIEIAIQYDGPAPELPAEAPGSPELTEHHGYAGLAGYLARTHADRVTAEPRDGQGRYVLHFDH